MMTKTKTILLALVLALTSCKSVVLRDASVYWNEIRFFEMALQKNKALLMAHLRDGSCSCDEQGKWSDVVCQESADTVAVLEARLAWHVAQMEYLGRFNAKEPPTEEPPIPDSSYLCNGDSL